MKMKSEFLEKTRVATEECAIQNSIAAALQHNPTYRASVTHVQRVAFRKSLCDTLIKFAQKYRDTVPDEEHTKIICEICHSLSTQYGQILRGSRLRIGTVQKALNLYLKFLWCLDHERAVPPHCPIDRIVLAKAGIDESWTRLDSIEIYMGWITQLRKVAERERPQSLQLWELSVWNNESQSNK